MTSGNDERYTVGALVRGLEVLRAFDEGRDSLSLTELATIMGCGRSLPYRLVYTLHKLGYLRQDSQTKRYQLGPKVLELGFRYLHGLGLPDLARPYLQELREETDASTHLGILEGTEVIYVVRVQARRISAVNIQVGTRLPAHATAIGKALLAHQPMHELHVLSGARLPAFTASTITNTAVLRRELETVRRQGLAFGNEEFENGIRSLAAPVFDESGLAVAALNIATLDSEMSEEFQREVAIPAVRKAAWSLSVSLGYRPNPESTAVDVNG